MNKKSFIIFSLCLILIVLTSCSSYNLAGKAINPQLEDLNSSPVPSQTIYTFEYLLQWYIELIVKDTYSYAEFDELLSALYFYEDYYQVQSESSKNNDLQEKHLVFLSDLSEVIIPQYEIIMPMQMPSLQDIIDLVEHIQENTPLADSAFNHQSYSVALNHYAIVLQEEPSFVYALQQKILCEEIIAYNSQDEEINEDEQNNNNNQNTQDQETSEQEEILKFLNAKFLNSHITTHDTQAIIEVEIQNTHQETQEDISITILSQDQGLVYEETQLINSLSSSETFKKYFYIQIPSNIETGTYSFKILVENENYEYEKNLVLTISTPTIITSDSSSENSHDNFVVQEGESNTAQQAYGGQVTTFKETTTYLILLLVVMVVVLLAIFYLVFNPIDKPKKSRPLNKPKNPSSKTSTIKIKKI